MAMTVVLVASLAESVSNFRAPLVRELVARGIRVIAVAPDLDDKSRAAIRALWAEPALVPFARTGMNPFADARGIFALYRFFRQHRPQAVLAYTAKPVNYGLLAARFAGVPVRAAMITGLGYAFTEGQEPRRRVARFAAGALYRCSLPQATSLIFQNPDDVALFRSVGILRGSSPVNLVNGSGVECGHYASTALPGVPHFLMVARLLKDKGVREYAEAARQLRRAVPHAITSLAGWIDSSPDAVTQAELSAWQADGLNFLGRLSDVRPAISQASVVVRAIITTDAPGCRETVVHGVNGLLVPPRDAGALARAMTELAGNPARVAAMGRESRRIAEEKYDAKAVALDTLRKAGILTDP
jgi:glycosyltransferase involved in cell wall biosynthesis